MTRTLALVGLALTGCANSPLIDTTTETAAQRGQEPTLYVIRTDYRRCVFPLCGGDWVSEVNARGTRCPVGGRAEECYVAETDVSVAPKAGEAAGMIAEGTFGTLDFSDVGFDEMGSFTVTRAWPAVNDGDTDHTIYRAADNGIVCITAPCYSTELTEIGRNGPHAHTTISGLDFSAIAAHMDASEEALVWSSLAYGDLFVAGVIEDDGFGGTVLRVDEAWYH